MTANPAMQLLVVDDDHNHREMLRALLEEWGYAPTGAASGEEALELCRERPFDLILMDVRMPYMDGLTATRQIRSSEHDDAWSIPILAMTANAFEEDIKKSLRSGMNGHLTKPVEPAELYRSIQEALDANTD